MYYLYTFLKRITFLLLLFSASRIYFFINNRISFKNANIFDFIEGIRFDLSALFYINIPILILLLFPSNLRINKYYRKITNYLFYTLNILFIIINNIDIEYFKFTQKRSTTDLFQLITLGEDSKNIIPQYLKSYWPITVFTLIQSYLIIKISEIPAKKMNLNIRSITIQYSIFIFIGALFIVCARGGLQLKPIKPINAGELTSSKNSGLILNTPFCILHSLGNEKLENYIFFENNKLKKIYSPMHNASTNKINKQNIIILIMESYSKEFMGFHNINISNTPFLDSLAIYSLVCNNAFSNGLKSIEALPAITASIPTLMNSPFITSDLARNKFNSLASLLKNESYNTSFFHGGIRGTMGFYSFSKKAGFQEYFGMEEYNNKTDFDGTWGIFDGPFFNFFANNLNKRKQPFFTTFFSLSSHPPYKLPDNYISEKSFNVSENINLTSTIKYSDKSMSKFFHKIKKSSWFNNTIFIITADHTSPVQNNNKYKNIIGRYSIPLIIFKGDSSLIGNNNNIVQQIDIMPTILDMINYNKTYFAFGKSIFSSNNWAINRLTSTYRFITKKGIIINKKDEYKMYQDWNLNNEIITDSLDINLLKAIKQTYNQRMIKNNLIYEN